MKREPAPKRFGNPPPPPPSTKQQQPTTATNNPWVAPQQFTEAANVIAPGMASNPMAQLAVNSLAQYGNSTISRYIPGVMVFWNAMRHHFNVDNNYVKKKLGLILFPKQNSWKRMTIGGPSHDNAPLQGGVTSPKKNASNLPPVQDVNAPDLYIPIMAFTTYVVMIGLLKGTVGEFTPDVLSQVMMSSLFMEFLQVLAIRVGFSLTRVPPENISSMDILSWSFYKYVGLCLTTLSYIFAGQLAYYIVLLYTSLALAWFYMCTFKDLYGGAFRLAADQKYFLFAVSAVQPVLMYWMSSYP